MIEAESAIIGYDILDTSLIWQENDDDNCAKPKYYPINILRNTQ
jgi:hypothetical protein